MRGPTILSVLLMSVAYASFEMMTHPTGADRRRLLLVLAGVIGFAVILRLIVDRMAKRTEAMATLLGIPVFAAITITGVAVLAAVKGMFFDTTQIPIVLVALAFGAGLAVFVASGIGQQASSALSSVISVAKEVGSGQLGSRTGVDRSDEIGELANAVDSMVAQLESAKSDRTANDQARDDFLAAVGHDLRTPLTAINAAVEAIEDGLSDDPARYLRVISQQSSVMGHLVTDVTTLASLEAGSVKREHVDLSELIDEAVEAFGPLSLKTGISITNQATGDGAIVGDPSALGRLLRNLLDNAVRHADKRVSIVMASTGALVTVTVSDDGPGFPTELRSTAFDRFITGDDSRRSDGFGLGLAIAKTVVDAHQGAIDIEAGPGGVVAFSLPKSS